MQGGRANPRPTRVRASAPRYTRTRINAARRVMRLRRVEQCKGVFDRRDYLNKMRRAASAVRPSRAAESFLRVLLSKADPLSPSEESEGERGGGGGGEGE